MIVKSKARTLISKLRRTELGWRYASNLWPTINHRIRGETPATPIERSLVNRLRSDGIAFTSVEELFADKREFAVLDSAVNRLIESKNEEITELRSKADENEVGSKTFNLEMLGGELTFDPKSVFARFALHPTFLCIAEAYFGMFAKLRYYNVWKTFASRGSARESQLWHFDREDNYILKVFLYLDDVDEGSGPFTYAPGTHRKGKYRSIEPEYFLEGGVRRTTDDQMRAVYPEERWVRAVGKKGTIIFADTRGYHKGGEARTKDRLMFTCMYTSPASESKRLIVYPDDLELTTFTPQQRRALQYK